MRTCDGGVCRIPLGLEECVRRRWQASQDQADTHTDLLTRSITQSTPPSRCYQQSPCCCHAKEDHGKLKITSAKAGMGATQAVELRYGDFQQLDNQQQFRALRRVNPATLSMPLLQAGRRCQYRLWFTGMQQSQLMAVTVSVPLPTPTLPTRLLGLLRTSYTVIAGHVMGMTGKLGCCLA